MNYVSFACDLSMPIEQELKKAIYAVAIERLPHGEVVGLELIRRDLTALKIKNVMHDERDRVEVGRLDFSVSKFGEINEMTIGLPKAFSAGLVVFKLIMKDQEIQIETESGVVLRAHDGQELSIVAVAFPHALSIEGIDFKGIGVREYPEANYRRLLF